MHECTCKLVLEFIIIIRWTDYKGRSCNGDRILSSKLVWNKANSETHGEIRYKSLVYAILCLRSLYLFSYTFS